MGDTTEKACCMSCGSETDQELQGLEQAPPILRNRKKLSKQLSMCEKPPRRDLLWERRRRQVLKKKSLSDSNNEGVDHDVTDEDLSELKGCIELGFGFNEMEGQKLCNTLPALDLYFAVNRQYLMSPVQSPGSRASSASFGASSPTPSPHEGRSSSFASPRSSDSDSWKICSPGEDPQQVKTKLRHWAQAVACSVIQSSPSPGGAG